MLLNAWTCPLIRLSIAVQSHETDRSVVNAMSRIGLKAGAADQICNPTSKRKREYNLPSIPSNRTEAILGSGLLQLTEITLGSLLDPYVVMLAYS